jgi:hypothetical protein
MRYVMAQLGRIKMQDKLVSAEKLKLTNHCASSSILGHMSLTGLATAGSDPNRQAGLACLCMACLNLGAPYTYYGTR